MKKVIVLIAILLTGMVSMVKAQAPKFGHIDMQQLIQIMPERQAAQDALEKESGEMEDMLATLQKELQTMYQEYAEKRETMNALIRQAKEDDITAKQQRIEAFRNQAEQQLQQKQQELLQPIFNKADSMITVVAKENSLLYVFDVSSRVVLYKSNQSLDLLPLVKKKMGVE